MRDAARKRRHLASVGSRWVREQTQASNPKCRIAAWTTEVWLECPSRFRAGWVAWDKDGKMAENQGEGVVTVGGNGFGCVVLRRSVVGQTVIQHSTPTGDFDPNFYYWLSRTRWKAQLDWGVECEHLDGATAISSVLEGQSC